MINDTGADLTDSSEKPSESEIPYPWIIGPFVDYIFVAGGAVWIMLLINYLLIGTELPFDKHSPRQLGLFSIALVTQHIFFDAHNIATYFRLWGSEDDRASFRFYRTRLLYVALGIFALGFVIRDLAGVLVYLYLAIVFWHYAMQTFGIAQIYCLKRNYVLSDLETDVFRVLMLSLSAYATVSFCTAQGVTPINLYGVASPFWIISAPTSSLLMAMFGTILGVATIAFVFVVGRKFFREKKMLPAPVVLLLATIGTLGCTPKPINMLLWIYIPGLYHGSQYIAVSLSYYLKERGLPEADGARLLLSREVRKWPAINYLGKTILIGTGLYIIVPHVFSLVSLMDYQQAAGLVLAVVNFHHFAADAAIWRLRDARTRKLLV